jgi:hypothetical protein
MKFARQGPRSSAALRGTQKRFGEPPQRAGPEPAPAPQASLAVRFAHPPPGANSHATAIPGTGRSHRGFVGRSGRGSKDSVSPLAAII